ncbi:MAG: TlyA family rRNA (cytidine-2'-O)-methyltransferase [Desulfobacteraceae bacterium]|jgi:23S rRNA (cytidine1920-2'-O)/16S rRNA (cytidine1409-2'-O)-methyltransferase|nr:MAG: TlyA family rRNA (cytidine-2'-O)-methyltransferase [Desulfobacteraceae bacterium]
MSAGKKRLDRVVVEKGLVHSRQRAQALIMAGKVLVNNHIVDKSGTLVFPDDDIVLQGDDHPYVSRGGVKLEKALHTLGININGFVCLDVGASTGGFTDCLLQHGAGRVYAVDVGYGQLAWKLRQNPRVVVIERMNIRHMQLETLPQLVDLVTIDVSFISLKKVVPEILKFMKKSAGILALIKPQFEVGKKNVGKGGVVRDPVLHTQVIENLSEFFVKKHLFSEWVIPSPILGPKGNREFFISLKYES